MAYILLFPAFFIGIILGYKIGHKDQEQDSKANLETSFLTEY